MKAEQKETYATPVLAKHELLRDITATRSGKGNCGFGNGGYDGVPGNSNCPDINR
ncbi:MAG: hypothetical protein NDI90_11405 [Nitrospira sp. BO4]|nr:hypothetical protein [Nitrospira sp. BO4]